MEVQAWRILPNGSTYGPTFWGSGHSLNINEAPESGEQIIVELSEYVLEPLRKGEEFTLYRGQHRNHVDAPSVLLLAPVSTHPPLESLKRMEHEYSSRAELDLSWAVRPLALSQVNGQTMLVLENPGGEPLDRLIQGPMEMTQFLRLAVGLATALSRLHKRGLIHKDIKPPNVLVTPPRPRRRGEGV